MTYTITSDQGRTVQTVTGQRNAEAVIRSLVRQGRSYSVESK